MFELMKNNEKLAPIFIEKKRKLANRLILFDLLANKLIKLMVAFL